ncbi:hypothetical protein [Siphonobacter curvatus]|uniref:Uncharacterized protein n=1 Tax=Siphonobacter curvatus TaxID=2094562 RepID=A0A2S7INW4_9BACT|nr:hypothetical protein [Siphonobacter curvatus]PQA59423.1 hypothetical protein C5O19_07160 [Siphonobacter curvatus]
MNSEERLIYLQKQIDLFKRENNRLRRKNIKLVSSIEWQNSENEWLWRTVHLQQSEIFKHINMIQLLKDLAFPNN